MTRKIAVAVIHGIGTQPPGFAREITNELKRRCHDACGDDVIIKPVHWAPVLNKTEKQLWKRLLKGGPMRWQDARRFLIDFLGDAFAYQITDTDRHVYDDIHEVFAKTLKSLANAAGENAPLCVIAHSLGSVIASNFIYDLQLDPAKHLISEQVRAVMGGSALERGETLALLYTLGSPIALWSLRYQQFGAPIRIPDPRLKQGYRALGEWVNFYDADDVVGSPLKTLNAAYGKVVTADREINVGGLLTGRTPLSHLDYWKDNDVLAPIAEKLIDLWNAVNPPAA